MAHLLIEMNRSVSQRYKTSKRLFKRVALIFFVFLYLIYYAGSLIHDPRLTKILTTVTVLAISIPLLKVLYRLFRAKINFRWDLTIWMRRNSNNLSRFANCIMVIVILNCLIFSVTSWRQMKAILLCIIMLFIMYISCSNKDKIKGKLIVTILFIHCIVSILVLRTVVGYRMFFFILKIQGKFVMWYSAFGAAFVYGQPFFLFHPVAMFVTSSAIYSTFIFGVILHVLRKTSAIKRILVLFRRLPREQLSAMLGLFYSFGSLYGLLFTTIYGMKSSDLVTTCVLYIPSFFTLHFISTPFLQPLNNVKPPKEVSVSVFVQIYKACFVGFKVAFTGPAIILAFSSLYYFFNDVVFWLTARVGLKIGLASLVGYLFAPFTYLLGYDGSSMLMISGWYVQRILGLSSDGLKLLGYMSLDQSMSKFDVSICTHLVAGFSSMAAFSILYPVFTVVSREKVLITLLPRLLFVAHSAAYFAAAVGVIFTPISASSPSETSQNLRLMSYWFVKMIKPTHNDVISLSDF